MKPLKRFSRNKIVPINLRLKSGVSETNTNPRTVSSKGVHSDKGFAKRALVLCNGEPPTQKLARQLARSSDLIVAADGGANVARKLGILPDIIIGDFDSIKPTTRKFFSTSKFIRVSRQDNTDLEKALDYLVEQGIQRATIIAATGNRLDHTLGNLSILWNYVRNMSVSVVGDGWTAVPVHGAISIKVKIGTTVSLVPFGACSGITLKGLQYPLRNASMNVGDIGVSNVVRMSPCTVDVRKGNMLLMILANYTSIQLPGSW